MWQLPGGSVNPKESLKKAALRELAEESGYSAKSCLGIGSYYVQNRLSDKKQYVFLCTVLFAHKLPKDHDEYIQTYWMSRADIADKFSKKEFDNINLMAALNIWQHYTAKLGN